MEKVSIPLSFSHADIIYEGWATPSDHQHPDGMASSYHVVLNETFFGDMSYQDGHWTISEQRPADLVAATGKALLSLHRPP
jgi:hypothetical protein